jgi:hypothetical protein
MGSTVTSLVVYNNTLIAGGYFSDADGLPLNYVAQHSGDNWTQLGTGMGGIEGQVMDLSVYNNELIAGGFFTTADGLTANHIAKWNGTNWSTFGTGISGIVYSLGEYNGDLIAGGLFLSAGDSPANHIASWNGSTWSPLGGGMAGDFYQYVFALTEYNGNLIAGGYFTESDGLTTNGIAQWDGTSWSSMSGGLTYPANVFGAHTFCVYGPDLIVGGLFSTAGAVGAAHIASWNSPLTETNELVTKEILSVYPNPATELLNITCDSKTLGSDYSLVDQLGRTIISGKLLLENSCINISNLKSGIYNLKVGEKNTKIIIGIE